MRTKRTQYKFHYSLGLIEWALAVPDQWRAGPVPVCHYQCHYQRQTHCPTPIIAFDFSLSYNFLYMTRLGIETRLVFRTCATVSVYRWCPTVLTTLHTTAQHCRDTLETLRSIVIKYASNLLTLLFLTLPSLLTTTLSVLHSKHLELQLCSLCTTVHSNNSLIFENI